MHFWESEENCWIFADICWTFTNKKYDHTANNRHHFPLATGVSPWKIERGRYRSSWAQRRAIRRRRSSRGARASSPPRGTCAPQPRLRLPTFVRHFPKCLANSARMRRTFKQKKNVYTKVTCRIPRNFDSEYLVWMAPRERFRLVWDLEGVEVHVARERTVANPHGLDLGPTLALTSARSPKTIDWSSFWRS